MIRMSRLAKKRNVTETLRSNSCGSGELSASEDVPEISPKKRIMNETSASSSDSEDYDMFQTESHNGNRRKPKCFSKNAILARRNRIKKKKYLEDLENEVKTLRAQTASLRTNVEGYRKDTDVLRKENRYLRNLLVNSGEIRRILSLISSYNKTGPKPSPSASKGHSALHRNQAAVKTECIGDDRLVNSIPNDEALMKAVNELDSQYSLQNDGFGSNIMHSDMSHYEPSHDEPFSLPSDLFSSIDHDLFSSVDHDYTKCDMNIPEDLLKGEEELCDIGVCLHIAKKKVSLELCHVCNESASGQIVNTT